MDPDPVAYQSVQGPPEPGREPETCDVRSDLVALFAAGHGDGQEGLGSLQGGRLGEVDDIDGARCVSSSSVTVSCSGVIAHE